MWVYLFPYLGIAAIYFFTSWKQRYPLKLPPFLLLIKSWLYVVLLGFVFCFPLLEIINHTGITHALNYLRVNSTFQLILGALFWGYLIYRAFHVSVLFSASIPSTPFGYLSRKQILKQLPFLWFLPILVLSLFIYIYYGFSFPPNAQYFLSVTLIIIFLNTPLISSYKVIVK